MTDEDFKLPKQKRNYLAWLYWEYRLMLRKN